MDFKSTCLIIICTLESKGTEVFAVPVSSTPFSSKPLSTPLNLQFNSSGIISSVQASLFLPSQQHLQSCSVELCLLHCLCGAETVAVIWLQTSNNNPNRQLVFNKCCGNKCLKIPFSRMPSLTIPLISRSSRLIRMNTIYQLAFKKLFSNIKCVAVCLTKL